jgi:hypothetical protein
MTKIDFSSVTKQLTDVGIEVRQHDGIWTTSFKFDAKWQQPAMLVLPDESDYFVAFSPVISKKLEVTTFEGLSIDALRAILRAQSKILLAKFEVWSYQDKTQYSAVSPCSTVNFDGGKLRRRLFACATLAFDIRNDLNEIE